MFEDSDAVQLATGQSFAAIEVDGGAPVCVGGVDIQVAFYALQLPASLRRYFGLLPIKAGAVGVSRLEGVDCPPGEMITPVLRVLPMGWTLALWTCQVLHEFTASTVEGVRDSNRLRDRRPAPRIDGTVSGFIHTKYVDNFVALGSCRGEVEAPASVVKVALGECGLPTHSIEEGTGGETLGWRFAEDAPIVGVSVRGGWRLRLGLEELCRRRRCSGDELRSVIGHFTFRALMRRELLACLSSCCAYIEAFGSQCGDLWDSVVRELTWCLSLLPLAFRDLAAPWCDRVTVTDASWWGCCILEKHAPLEEIRDAPRYCHRWRFRRDEELDEAWAAERGEPGSLDADRRSSRSSSGAEDEELEEPEKAQRGSDDARRCHAEGGAAGRSAAKEAAALVAIAGSAGLHRSATIPGRSRKVGVREISPELRGGEWRRVMSRQWVESEALVVLEGRALVTAFRRITRRVGARGCWHLVLSDAMSVVLALSKGRSSAPRLLQVCRKWSAYALAGGISVFERWVPSKHNAADDASRGRAGRTAEALGSAAPRQEGYTGRPPTAEHAAADDARAERSRGDTPPRREPAVLVGRPRRRVTGDARRRARGRLRAAGGPLGRGANFPRAAQRGGEDQGVLPRLHERLH